MSINATGFVDDKAGSVASANAMLLRGLLQRGHAVQFFTKPSFVDPRSCTKTLPCARFATIDCTNRWSDGIRRKLAPRGKGLWGLAWSRLDAWNYNRKLVRTMQSSSDGELDVWLGDWARGRGCRPVVSFVQGPPGTDARSIERHERLIVDLVGRLRYEQLRLYARYRLRHGLPPFENSDWVVVGSRWSCQEVNRKYGFAVSQVCSCPYPIDLEAFQLAKLRPRFERLRILWLGRFVPRKRLDLFLEGLKLAIENGVDIEAWIVGTSGFVANYERLITNFPYQDRIRTWASIPRSEVPQMLGEVDVLAQPSEDEDFGSSIAESLACGVPVIAGATNGTGDYICENSVRLADYAPETFAATLCEFAEKKRAGELADRSVSRRAAERWFDPELVVDQLEVILQAAIDSTTVHADAH